MKNVIFFVFLLLIACEKEKLPTTPTVINGSVVDENDVPIPNVYIVFYGTEYIGFRGGSATTFSSYEYSDEKGTFSFSQVMPNETDEIELIAMGVFDSSGLPPIPNGFEYAYFINDQFISNSAIYFNKDNKVFGNTTALKIKLTKK